MRIGIIFSSYTNDVLDNVSSKKPLSLSITDRIIFLQKVVFPDPGSALIIKIDLRRSSSSFPVPVFSTILTHESSSSVSLLLSLAPSVLVPCSCSFSFLSASSNSAILASILAISASISSSLFCGFDGTKRSCIPP